MGKKSAPPAPDYTAAVNAQAQASAQNTAAQTAANRPNINTPWGSMAWTNTPGENGQDNWTANVSLSPQQQSALDSQFAIQQGMSSAAMGMMPQVQQAMSQGMNWDALPARSGNMGVPSLQGGWQDAAYAGTGVQQGIGAPSQGMQGSVGGQRPNTLFGFNGSQGPAQNQAGNSIQTGVGMGTAPTTSSARGGAIQDRLSQSAGDWRQTAQGAVEQLQAPQLAQRRAAAQTELANQGITQGSEAYTNAMRDVNDAESRAGLQAIAAGREEAGQLFGQDLASGQFANSAQGQGFGQNFANAGMGNALNQQQFGQNLAAGQFGNAANAQGWLQGQQGNQQQFNQALQGAQFTNQAIGDDFGRGLQGANLANQVNNQQFGQNAANTAVNNQAQQQRWNQLMQRAQFGDQQAMNQLQANIQSGTFNNMNRQQAISEGQQRQMMPLNMMNALLSGNQVGMPQMPNFSQSGRADTPNYFGAQQAQYNAALDGSNASNGMMGSAMGGLFQLGGAAMNNGGWSNLFNFSDRRLKKDIVPLGTLGGVNVYEYEYVWGGGRRMGVMAQEVPHAAVMHPSGYLMVDYSRVW